jgi:hypothetical protein
VTEPHPLTNIEQVPEQPDMGAVDRPVTAPNPHDEVTRRGLLVGLGTVFLLTFAVNIVLALLVSDATWARVGPTLNTFTTIIAAAAASATTYYFTRDRR